MKMIVVLIVVAFQIGCLSSGSADGSASAPSEFATDWAGAYAMGNPCEIVNGSWVCESGVPSPGCATIPDFTDTRFTIESDGSSIQFVYKSLGISAGTESTGPTGNYQIDITFPAYNWSMTLVTLSRFPGMADPFTATPPATEDSIVAVFGQNCAFEYTRTVSQ